MSLYQFSLHRRAVIIRGLILLLVIVGLYLVIRNQETLLTSFPYTITDTRPPPPTASSPSHSHSPSPRPLSLFEADEFPLEHNQSPSFCSDRYGLRYLDDLQEHSIQYCSPGSATNLTCFHSHTQQNQDLDTLCLGKAAVLQPSGTFDLGCKIRAPDESETSRGLIPFEKIRSYWYDTGPGYVFANYVGFSDSSAPAVTAEDRRFALLIKREGARNLWHSLMEIWSMTLTVDTLRLAPDAQGGEEAMFRYPEDVANTQVIILDDHEDGPFFDLWSLFSGRKPLRLKDILADQDQTHYFQTHPHNLIVPLAGGSNPLWQNDWEERDCQQATLLKIFVRRVMKHYNVEYSTAADVPAKKNGNDIKLTFIERRGTRKLENHASLLDAISKKYDHVEVRSVDFASISLAEQLRLVQETDILVGVHGAGLTHTMFMREGAGVVVEILPDGLNYKGFRNMAVMTGHRYFHATADIITPPKEERVEGTDSGNSPQSRRRKRDAWHFSDVHIGEEAFVKLIDEAVESL